MVCDIEENAGASSRTVYLPKWSLGGSLVVSVLEDGRSLDGYVGRIFGPSDTRETLWIDSAQGRFGWIAEPGSTQLRDASSSAQIDDLRLFLAAIAPEILALPTLTASEAPLNILTRYGQLAGVTYWTPEQLVGDRRAMQQCDVWVLRGSTYRWLAENRPEVELALRQHVRCGGALWLAAADDDEVSAAFPHAWRGEWIGEGSTPITPEVLGVAEALANQEGSPREFAAEGAATQPPAAEFIERAWKEQWLEPPDRDPLTLLKNTGYSTFTTSGLIPRRRLHEDIQSGSRGLSVNSGSLTWVENNRGEFAWSDAFSLRVGSGIVVACRRDDSVPGSYSQWRRMLEMTGEHSSNVLTHAVDPVFSNFRYWNWLIPGVAQPPVYTFIALMGVFVILVGPIAYRRLSRMGRSYLMFVVAPLLAALTTVSLIGYGLVADGLRTKARIRQFTWVCDRDGGTLRHWRSTYFAGVRPAEGLAFPADATLRPIHRVDFAERFGRDDTSAPALSGTIHLGGDSLRLGSGFLPSRQQMQYVAYRPIEGIGGLQWSGGNSDSPLSLLNGFDFELREVVARDQTGRHWMAARIAAGETAAMTLLDPADAARTLNEMYVRHRPEVPAGVTIGSGRVRAPGRAGQTDWIGALAATAPWKDTAAAQRAGSREGVLEFQFRQQLQSEGALLPETFLAFADVTPDCIAVPGTDLLDSVHYVMGVVR